MRRRPFKLPALIVPVALLLAAPAVGAQTCDEALAGLEQRVAEAEIEEHQRDRIGEMMESARLFQDLEREEACLRLVEEAGRVVDEIEEGSAIEARAAEQLGRATEADETNPLADVPSYRLIGRIVIDAEGARVGELIDVSASDGERERTAVVRVGDPLDDDKKTVAVPMSKFDPDERERLHLIDMTGDDLRELPAYDPLFSGRRSGSAGEGAAGTD